MDGCALKPPVLEVLASGVRKSSSLRRLSLRQNKINNQGALWLGVMLRDYDDQDLDKGLEELDVTNNDIRAGIQYIAQALRRNKSLQKLSLCDCKIDSKGCALIGEALVCLLVDIDVPIVDLSEFVFDRNTISLSSH